MKDFDCAIESPAVWAAVRVTSGAEVYFLSSTTGPWTVHGADTVCGGDAPRVPDEILAYCPKG